MDFAGICRTCLGTDFLNPIFADINKHQRYSSAVFATTGIKVQLNDGLPQNMCTNCINTLNNFLKFRKHCQDSEKELQKIKKEYKDEKTNLKTKNDHEKIEFVNEYLGKIEKDLEDIPLKYLIGNKVELNKNRVPCKICQKVLSVRSIDVHMARSHPGADEKRVKCELCDSYILKDKLERHQKLIHGTESFQCGYCKMEYDSKAVLIEHVATCSAKKRKRRVWETGRQLAKCNVCEKTMQKASLRMHVAVKHAGLGPVCEHCGVRLGNGYRLREHLRAKHSALGHERLRCHLCEFTAAGSAALQNHLRRHAGEKPFVCEVCGAGFHAASLLLQHRHSHRTERSAKCDICGASFKANNSLHMHRRAVHGAARVQCSQCPRLYRTRHYAVKHLRTVHRYKGPVPQLQTLSATTDQPEDEIK